MFRMDLVFILFMTCILCVNNLMGFVINSNVSCPSVFSCANCTAIRLCMPNPTGSGFIEIDKFNCSGTTPYCDDSTGTCQATPSLNCTVMGEFVCLQDGTFPHPTDCTKYYVCANLVSHTIQCRQNYYYYDDRSHGCAYASCVSFNCAIQNGVKVQYPTNPALYAYCITGQPAIIDKCNGKDQLNTTTQQCEPVCQHEGLIPDTQNTTRYYKCTSNTDGSQFEMTKMDCPSGEQYVMDQYQCLPPSSRRLQYKKI